MELANTTKIQCPAEINTIDDVEQLINFFQEVAVGHGFHPDTNFEDYVNTNTGLPVFNAEKVELYNRLLEDAFAICYGIGEDIYEIGLEALLGDDPHSARNNDPLTDNNY